MGGGESRFLDTFFSLNALCRCQAPTGSVLKKKEHEIEWGKRQDGGIYSKRGESKLSFEERREGMSREFRSVRRFRFQSCVKVICLP